ncbi:hypothetical protein [Helicobacter mesocricetorum]|uniref:hypothetical protein n=1 Tax=Helicobacter mesocricetorum TaxID=87012 RepID=UPI0018F82B5E|nr:hypothetical protein [Helicobacter mesocricetorum]
MIIDNEYILLWVGAGVGLVFVLLMVYFYLKDADNTKRYKRYEKSIEELNKEIYRLQKKLKTYESDLESFKQSFKQQIYQDTRLEMKNLIDMNLHSQVIPLKSQIERLGEEYKHYKEEVEGKVFMLEDRIKEFAYTPTNPTNIDEGRIISMFKDGWSVDSIAKELRIGKGEVEFTLKFANLG